jgi:catechol 2,3-dioxygenase-like lactoylglutathione lyase family enzyme
MLSEYRVHTALPATNLDRARRFYDEKLGLTPTDERPEGLTYECAGGSALFLFPTAISGRGGHTQVGIEVPDVKAAVAELESRGVVFEDYDAPGETAAWFKDSEGNLLGLVQFA